MTLKKIILTLALVGVGIYGLQRCSSDVNPKETVSNVNDTSKIERLIEEERLQAERKKSLAESLKYVSSNPEQTKDYVLEVSEIGLKSSYKREIWERLSKEDKWGLVKEVAEYRGKEFWKEVKDLSGDAYEKFKETKLYDNLKNERR